ncbi:MAG: cytochrome c-type bioproteinis protein CcmH [Rhodospirillaceae bacterium]|nr:MAG: cytochrome c-type bioproteinis protein CcmH [Rhodospirillaceae bacterium]
MSADLWPETFWMFWGAAGVLLVLTVAVLVTPLMGRRCRPLVSTHDLAVYKDQLAEVERDVARGLLTAEQAAGTRIEIQRRMLRVSEAPPVLKAAASGGHRWLAGVVGVFVPVGTIGLYLTLGAPNLPDQPVAVGGAEARNVEHLVDELTRRMEANPERVEGWLLLARSQQQLERYALAARSFRMAIERGADGGDILASYGEMLVQSRNGQVPPEAAEAFHRAFRADPKDPRAAFYLGLAAWQGGDSRRALALWRGLEERSPPQAPWLETLHRHMTAVVEQAGLNPTAIAPLTPGEE